MRRAALLVLALVVLSGCAAPDVEETVEELAAEPAREPVRFLAWGDGGHGNERQNATARAAAQVCARQGCDLVLLLGDNVYPDGPKSARDPQFRAKFEEPYAPLNVPFYVVLGNHDAEGAEHELAYAETSSKWRMPARSYVVEEGDVAFFAVDMTGFAGDAALDDEANATLAWLSRELDRSEARWKVVFGHFPYAANGKYGPATGALQAFLEQGVCGKAHLYLAGHEHTMEWLAPQPGCPGTELVVSGAFSDPRPLGPPEVERVFGRGNETGFFGFEVEGDRLTGRAYGGDGSPLFERVLTVQPSKS